MFIHRKLEDAVISKIGTNKVILILGTRRVGKTYLINSVSKKYTGKKMLLNGEDFDVQEILKKRSEANYKQLINDTDLLMIDEAQAIPEIGSIMKLMIDSQPHLTIIATGSSSLDLVNASGEPLTGRNYSYNLYPIAQLELGNNPLQAQADLDERLVIGSYPEIFHIQTRKEKEQYLRELINSYLLKDILSYSGIRQSYKLMDLLRLVAFQIGSEVSYNEIASQLSMNKITVENYLDLLQKVFILFKLPS
jgi:predicted AAA+ superfamily ATPase